MGTEVAPDRRRAALRLGRRYWLTLVPWGWYLVRDLGPWLDGVALALPLVVAGAVVVSLLAALLLRTLPAAAVVASWVVFGLVVIVLPWAPIPGPAPEPGLRLAAVNVKASKAPDGILDSLARTQPDVVVVSEVSDELDARLAERYRWRVRSEGRRGDVAVFADRPLRSIGLPPELAGQRGVSLEVDGAGGPFVLYAMHLVKPGPEPVGGYQVTLTGQRSVVAALARAVARERRPTVVAGDLNLSDRTWGYRRLTSVLDDGARAGWTGPTSIKPTTKPMLLRIDHILMPPSWCSARSDRLTLPGSDHKGVASTIGPCPKR